MKITKPKRTVTVPPVTEYRILITGSRDWADIDTINKELNRLIVEIGVKYRDVLVMAGGATGADTLAKDLCLKELGIAFAEFSAPWDFFARIGKKRSAGPVRNAWQLRWGSPNAVLAFHPYLPGSRGTRNQVTQAREWARRFGQPSIIRIIDKEIKP